MGEDDGSETPPRSSRRSSSASSTSSTVALPIFESLAPTRSPTTVVAEETIIKIPFLAKDVRLKVDAGPSCGGIAWPSGEVLSRYLAYRHNHDTSYLKNRTIIELGSGTGLVGIVAAQLESTSDVWITDQSVLLGLMEQNAILNLGTSSNIQAVEYDWGGLVPVGLPVKEATVVLAADCVYFEPAFPLLVKTLCDLAPVGKAIEILFCWKRRRKADKRFFAMLKKHFTSTPVEDDKSGEREKYNSEGITLLRLQRRK